jgi:hypothetical protein
MLKPIEPELPDLLFLEHWKYFSSLQKQYIPVIDSSNQDESLSIQMY